MSNQNKNTIASQALLDMDKITAALKEESQKTLNMLLSEAVKTALREECEEDDDKEYEVEDETESPKDKDEESSKDESGDVSEDENDDQMQNPQQVGGNPPAQGQPAASMEEPMEEPAEAPEDGDMGPEDDQMGGEEDMLSKYQVGDNTYDLTGENDHEAVAKVYKLLNDDDDVIVKQDGNTIQLRDNQANTEYVIDFGDDDQGQYDEEPNQDNAQLNEDEDFSIAGFPDDETNEFDDEEFELADEEFGADELEPDYTEDDDFNLDLNDNYVNDENSFEDNNIYENKKSRKPMKENKNEMIFEIDLGYTDNYQDKDPISGLSNEEPSKSGKSWHKGVPTGTKKPWAGDTKSKGKPFEKTQEINEEDDLVGDEMSGDMEEATNVGGAVQQRTTPKSHIPDGRKNYGPNNKRHVSTTPDGYDEIVAELKQIKAENKKLKESTKSLLKNLSEAYVTNYNLGKITKLFVENVTTQEEKVDIVNRFATEAKTRKQADMLFESIKKELSKSHSNTGLNLNESSVTANGTKKLNEACEYASNDLLKTKDLMNRIMNL